MAENCLSRDLMQDGLEVQILPELVGTPSTSSGSPVWILGLAQGG